jgi:hypothetical protein
VPFSEAQGVQLTDGATVVVTVGVAVTGDVVEGIGEVVVVVADAPTS